MRWSWKYDPGAREYRLTIVWTEDAVRIHALDTRRALFEELKHDGRASDTPRMLRALADKAEAELGRS